MSECRPALSQAATDTLHNKHTPRHILALSGIRNREYPKIEQSHALEGAHTGVG